VETNPPRNSRSQTHQNDGTRGEARQKTSPRHFQIQNQIGLIDLLMPQKTHNESFSRLKLFGWQSGHLPPLAISGLARTTPPKWAPSPRRH